MPRNWYIKTKNGQHGPVRSKTLIRLARKGILTPRTAVSPDGETWVKAKKISGLKFPKAEEKSKAKKQRSSDWYIQTKHSVAGPFTVRQLEKLARKGKLKRNIAVSRDRKNWIKAKRVPGLDFAEPFTDKAESTAATQAPSPNVFVHQPELPWPDLRQIDWEKFKRPPTNWSASDDRGDVVSLSSVDSPLLLLDWLEKQAAFKKASGTFAEHAKHPPTFVAHQPNLPWPDLQRLDLKPLNPMSVDPLPLRDCQQADAIPTAESRLPLLDWMVEQSAAASLETKEEVAVEAVIVVPPAIDQRALITTQAEIELADEPDADESEVDDVVADIEPEVDAPAEKLIVETEPTLESAMTGEQGATQTSDDDVAADPAPNEPVVETDSMIANEAIQEQTAEPIARPVPTQQSVWHDLREAEYVRCFGEFSHVARPRNADSSSIDVYVHPPNATRPFTTLVTSGMSDRHMLIPQSRCSSRAELVIYLRHMHPGYIELLRSLAQVPAQHDRGFWYGATMDNGEPARPIFQDSALNSFVFMMPNVESDFNIQQRTFIGNDPLQLLWVVPITCAERAFIARHGMAEFCQLLNHSHHDMLLDPNRSCYIGAASSHLTA